jgi:hypothetical protein
VGSVSYNAPEVTVVKQPITVDQPEVKPIQIHSSLGFTSLESKVEFNYFGFLFIQIHYRSVPTVVHQTSVVKAAPIIAAPIATPSFAYSAHAQPALAYNYNAYNYNQLAYGALPAFGYAQAF